MEPLGPCVGLRGPRYPPRMWVTDPGPGLSSSCWGVLDHGRRVGAGSCPENMAGVEGGFQGLPWLLRCRASHLKL